MPGRTQNLPVRAAIFIRLIVEDEVSARKYPFPGTRALPHRNMRRDAGADELAEEAARPVRRSLVHAAR